MSVRECAAGPAQDYCDTPIHAWLRESPELRPTAVVAWCDVAAFEFIAYCRMCGLSVPDDVAVAGFDGFAVASAAPGRLTTVRAPWSEVGRTAVALLVAHLGGIAAPPETVLPVEFIAGDTS